MLQDFGYGCDQRLTASKVKSLGLGRLYICSNSRDQRLTASKVKSRDNQLRPTIKVRMWSTPNGIKGKITLLVSNVS